jgi:CheY-like chemotaxis protein
MTTDDRVAKPMVLVVHPDEDMRSVYGDWFASRGFDVVCATEAFVALVIAQAYQPELIVTELRLRRSDGLQLIRGLQARAATRHLPILVVTVTTLAEAVHAATAAGAVAVLPALADIERLDALVASIVVHPRPVPAGRRCALPWNAILNRHVPPDSTPS